MRAQPTLILVATAVFLAACGPAENANPSSSTTEPPTSAPEVAAVAFAYSYEPGDHHEYDFTLDQNLDMTVESLGNESLLGEEPPQDINVTTSIVGTIAYDIAAGPEPGSRQIAISGVFEELEIDGTVDGEPVEEEMIEDGAVPDLIEVPDITIVIDESGNLVSVDGVEIPEDLPFFGDPFSELGDFTSGGLSGHFGPVFPEEPLAVGDTWSFTHSEEIEGLDTTVAVDTDYEVTGTEKLAGREVAVIEFTTNTSEVAIDLGEMFQALFDTFGELGEELAGETTGTTEVPELTFLITVAPSTAQGTVWFDQEAGIVANFTQETAATISMLMEFSEDEETVHTAVQLDLDMHLAAQLLDGS